MFGPKSGLRVLAALTIAALTATTPLSSANAANGDYASTVRFLADKFVDGKALDGFTPGTPDYGFTLEAMLQRKAGGQKLTDLSRSRLSPSMPMAVTSESSLVLPASSSSPASQSEFQMLHCVMPLLPI